MSKTNLTVEQLYENALQSSSCEQKKKPEFSVKALLSGRALLSAVILVLSVAIILLSLFFPLSYSGTVSLGFDVDIRYSGTDVFRLCYYSLASIPYNQLEKTPLYEETMSQYASFMQIAASGSYLSESEGALLRDMTKNMLFLTLFAGDSQLRFQLVFAAISVIAMLIISAVMLYSSAVSLCRELSSKGKNKKSGRSHFLKQIYALWAFFLLLPAFAHSFSSMGNFGVGEDIGLFSSEGFGASAGIAAIIVCTVLVSVLAAAHLILINRGKIFRPNLFNRRKLILIILFLLLVISLFLPAINVKFIEKVGNVQKTESVPFSLKEFYTLSEADIQYYRTTTASGNRKALQEVAKQMFTPAGVDGAVSRNILNTLIFGVERNDIRDLFVFVQLLSYAVIIVSSLLVIYLAKNIFERLNCDKTVKRLKILLFLLQTAQVVLCISILVIANLSLDSDLSAVMSCGIGAGPILSVLLTVSIMFFKLGKPSKNSYADDWYDNADVSYAPYVVQAKKV